MELLKIFGIKEIEQILWLLYLKIGGGRIYRRFCNRAVSLIFASLFMLGVKLETCEDMTVRGLPGDIVLSLNALVI